MKTWLLKFRVSSALDQKRPLSRGLQNALVKSDEARRFARNCGELDRKLKTQLPKLEKSEERQLAIMRAIRNSSFATGTENNFAWPRWVPISSTALLLVLGAALTIEYLPRADDGGKEAINSQTLAAARAALEAGGRIVREAPGVAMSPMSSEIKRLDRDLDSTRQFLVASLP